MTYKFKSSEALRVIVRSEMLCPETIDRARLDLPFPIEFTVIDSLASLRQVISQPKSFDVYHQWHTVDLMWTAGVIQPIELRKLKYGQALLERARQPLASYPFSGIFVEPNGKLGSEHSSTTAILPITHGVDCFGLHPSVRELFGNEERESWGWLLDERIRSQVAMISDPVLGMIEAALATEAIENTRFSNVANLSIDEIDHVISVLILKKKQGHFKGFWSSTDDAERFMLRGGVKLQSMFGPVASNLRRAGYPIRVANAKEGGRGWHTDLCISRDTRGGLLDAAYLYLDWWLSGFPGAAVSRRGDYTILPGTAKAHLDVAEWDYWYNGKPAACDLRDELGEYTIPAGSLRDGGSYTERITGVRVWNAFMDEHAYLTHRWREFLES